MADCNNCDGKGVYWNPQDGDLPYCREITCPHCGGTGEDRGCHNCKHDGVGDGSCRECETVDNYEEAIPSEGRTP